MVKKSQKLVNIVCERPLNLRTLCRQIFKTLKLLLQLRIGNVKLSIDKYADLAEELYSKSHQTISRDFCIRASERLPAYRCIVAIF